MTLLEQCQLWTDNGEYQKIIDALEALPEAERTPETDSELARAYNNIAGPGDKDLFKKALALLKPHAEYFADDHCWNFRMAYAYYFLDKEYLALPYFEKALAARPGDEDTQKFIDDCRSLLALPKFNKSFRQRTQEAWETFLAQEAELRRLLDYEDRETVREFLLESCRQILQIAFDDISFEIGNNGAKYELTLTPQGDKAQLFKLAYFQKFAPPQVFERWNIIVGRPAAPECVLRSDEWTLNGDDVQAWVERRGENEFALQLYCAALTPLLAENENQAWWMLSTLTDITIGEIAAMAYIVSFEVLSAPKTASSVKLSELPQLLRSQGFNLDLTAQEFLDNSYVCYELDAVQDPDADWRLDVFSGSARLAALINEYLRGDSDVMNAFHADGAVPGFLCYPLNGFDGEERAQKILDLRDALEKFIVEDAGTDAVITFVGGATGLYCGYLDFIAWDLRAVLDAAVKFFKNGTFSWAAFHSFRRDVGAVRLLKREAKDEVAPPLHEATGSLLSPEDIAALQAFDEGVSGYFYKMFDYLERFIKDGVDKGAFSEQQAKEDLQIANWYAFAGNNIDRYDYYYKVTQWMPASEKNAEGCATWYYRYSAALMYCGKLQEAWQYAERGAQEEPDYPWIWLQVAKLRSHFGDKDGALDAVRQGLKAVPGDYEFLTLQKEILAGEPLERMGYHWINPDADRNLQEGLDADADDKQRALACLRTNADGLKYFHELFQPAPTDYTKNNPFCRFYYSAQGRKVDVCFRMNEAGLSKMNADWLASLKERLDNGVWLEAAAADGAAGTLAAVFVNQDYHVGLLYQQQDAEKYFQIFLRPDGSRMEDAEWSADEPTADEAAAAGDEENAAADAPRNDDGAQATADASDERESNFCGFVLLSDASWDKQKLLQDLREEWDIDAVEDEDEKDGDSRDYTLVFSVGDMMAALSLMPAPIPGGEAEENARNNFLWPQAEAVAQAHRAHILVAVIGKETDLLERGKLFVKLLAACCRQKNATGIYTSGVVFEPRFYEGVAAMLKEGELPVFNWIWFGLYRSEKGVCGYTYGMNVFGKDEMEVLDADAEPSDVRDFLSGIAAYVLGSDVTLSDGETIGFTADDKHAITRGPGVALPEQTTLKISYAAME